MVYDYPHLDDAPLRRAPERIIPSRLDSLLFNVKVLAFRSQRVARDVLHPAARLQRGAACDFPVAIARSRTPLWSDIRVSERAMQRGKVHNLRRAAQYLDRTIIPAGTPFSFWRQVGPPVHARGFVPGRMLQEGCLVASMGGGLCQLSNALYDVALQAGCNIIERHAHSRIVPGSVAQFDRDATVAWNYVDLRFSSPQSLLLRVVLDGEFLNVSLAGAQDINRTSRKTPVREVSPDLTHAADCASCGETSCFRHGMGAGEESGRTAFLVDEFSPEFDRFIAQHKQPGDVLCLPLDGARWKRKNYAWTTDELKIVSAPVTTFARAIASRRLAAQGAARQTQLLRDAQRMARRLARGLDENMTEVVVAQSYLPFLWQAGCLGGRRFSVLMNRLPMYVLHERLDKLAEKYPQRVTLSDFRADNVLVAAEEEALAAAQHLVTPHAEIAALFGARASLLEWKRPAMTLVPRQSGAKRIAFPGPTAARKGAYELREVARALDLETIPLGVELEGEGFWDDVRIARPEGTNWLENVAAVVQPALVEERPRRLLAALAAGVPVIATPACGLPPQAGLILVAPDDPQGLSEAIQSVLFR